MQINIEAPHIAADEIPESLIRNKFDHLNKLYDRIEYCNIVLRKEKSDTQQSFFMEARLNVPKEILFSSHRSASFEATLDEIIHDLEKQLQRYKGKQNAF